MNVKATELLAKARAGAFNKKATAPAVMTRFWQFNLHDNDNPLRGARWWRGETKKPTTAAELTAIILEGNPNAPIPEFKPQKPYWVEELSTVLDFTPANDTPVSNTTPAPAGIQSTIVDSKTPPAPVIELTGEPVTVTRQCDKAHDILAAENVTVVIVDTLAGAVAAIEKLQNAAIDNPLGIDIETAPLPEYAGAAHGGLNPHSSVIRLVQIHAPSASVVYVFDVLKLDGIAVLKPLLECRRFVAHNALFELKHLQHAGVVMQPIDCTMLMANVYYNGGRHSLANVTAATLGWAIDKTEQTSNWAAIDLTPAQFEYAALDAVAASGIYAFLEPLLKQAGKRNCYELLRDTQPAVAQLELTGCPFDTAAHTELLARYQAIAEAARGELDSLLGINPDSPAQLANWLSNNLPADAIKRWPRTAKGALATDADTLSGLTLPELEPLARYKKARKMLSTYGTSYAAHIHPATGRLHPSFLIGGTDTGRFSCQQPNTQNPPRDKEFRALFAPKDGRVFVVADYSQIELRVAALVSGDKAMLRAYANGEDLHRLTAAAVAGKAPADISKAERQMAKAVNFGLLFGAGAPSLQNYAATAYGVEMTLGQAQAARAAFFKTYPEFERWQKKQRGAATAAGQVRTPSGRVRPLDGARALATESLNTPIQGGAAEALQAALAALVPLLQPLGAHLVNMVHDELVVECAPDNAPAVARAVEAAMVEGFLAVFPGASTRDLVEAHTGANWADAKP